jgi:hypothetical protein
MGRHTRDMPSHGCWANVGVVSQVPCCRLDAPAVAGHVGHGSNFQLCIGTCRVILDWGARA